VSSAALPWSDFVTFIVNGERVAVDMTATGDVVNVVESALLFCSSSVKTEELTSRMHTDFGNEAAYEIADIDEFGHRLLAALNEEFEVRGGLVTYGTHIHSQSLAEFRPVDPFLKPERFGWQQEHRLVFNTSGTIEDSAVVEVPSVCELLRIVL
ncbi:MAG: hypothetical protein ACRC0L_10260, partial [Angustibacter sp.]